MTERIKEEKLRLKAIQEAERKDELARASKRRVKSSARVHSDGTGPTGQQRGRLTGPRSSGGPSNASPISDNRRVANAARHNPDDTSNIPRRSPYTHIPGDWGFIPSQEPQSQVLDPWIPGPTADTRQQRAHTYATPAGQFAWNVPWIPGFPPQDAIREQGTGHNTLAGQHSTGIHGGGDSDVLAGACLLLGDAQMPGIPHVPEPQQINISQRMHRPPEMPGVEQIPEDQYILDLQHMQGPQRMLGYQQMPGPQQIPGYPYAGDAGPLALRGAEPQPTGLAPASTGHRYVQSSGNSGAAIESDTVPQNPPLTGMQHTTSAGSKSRQQNGYAAHEGWANTSRACNIDEIFATSEAASFWYDADCAGTGCAAPPRPTPQTGAIATTATQSIYMNAAGREDTSRSVPPPPVGPSVLEIDHGIHAPNRNQYGHWHTTGTGNIGRNVPPAPAGPPLLGIDSGGFAIGHTPLQNLDLAGSDPAAIAIPAMPVGPPAFGTDASRSAASSLNHGHGYAVGSGGGRGSAPPALGPPPVFRVESNRFALRKSLQGTAASDPGFSSRTVTTGYQPVSGGPMQGRRREFAGGSTEWLHGRRPRILP